MDDALSENGLDMRVNLTYLGKDGLNRHRRISEVIVDKETLGILDDNGNELPPLDNIICESPNELEVCVVLKKEGDSAVSGMFYKWKWSVVGEPWHYYFKALPHRHVELVCMIRYRIIQELFFILLKTS